jgi:phosphoadenosine phosphosulfate reductase
MPKAFLGPLVLKWCTHCNLPILEKNKCDICKNYTTRVNISPPGDLRPALTGNINIIREKIDEQYGEGVGRKIAPDNKIIILNKIGATESSDEIIIDGKIIGLIIFDPLIFDWYFRPKLEGARRLITLSKKKFITVADDAAEFIKKGANVLKPGIVDYDKTIKKEDYVSILDETQRVIGIGISKVDGQDIGKIKRDTIIKTKKTSEPMESLILEGGQTWENVMKANQNIMEHKINKSKKIIRTTSKKLDKPVIVSFSGGKDSLCVLVLVYETLNDFKVLFIDTGIEFTETIEHVNQIMEKLGLKDSLIYERSMGDFWEGLKEFGPPARDFRYCCKTLKLSAATDAIAKNFEGEIINFTGTRRYESIPRSQEKMIWTNPYVPNQINVAPIRDWTHLHVWLYLKMKNIPINELYYKGYQRIGCMYCPANKLSELKTMRDFHPQEYNRFIQTILEWAKKYGYPEEWVYLGFWRWKQPGPKQRQLAAVLGINLKPEIKDNNEKDLKFSVTQEMSPCKDGTYIIEGKFNRGLNLKTIVESFNSIGDSKFSEELGFLYLKTKDFSVTVYAEGSLKINLKNRNQEKEILDNILKLIIRAIRCTNCKICVKACPESAIKIVDNLIKIDKNKCTKCLKCLEGCPGINYTFPFIIDKNW